MVFATSNARIYSDEEFNAMCRFRRGQRLELTLPVRDLYYDQMRRSLRIDTLYSYEGGSAPTSRVSAFVNNVDPVEAGMEMQRFREARERAEAAGSGTVPCVTLEIKIDQSSRAKSAAADPEAAALLLRGEVKYYPFTLKSWYALHSARSSSLLFGTGRF